MTDELQIEVPGTEMTAQEKLQALRRTLEKLNKKWDKQVEALKETKVDIDFYSARIDALTKGKGSTRS